METKIISICAFFLSLISIGATIFFSWSQRDHNRKSVKPIPYLRKSDWENRIYVAVKNCGVGPMIIRSINATYKCNGQSGHLIDLMPQLPVGMMWNNFTRINEIYSLLPGSEFPLIEIEGDLENKSFCNARDEIRKVLKDTIVKVDYTNVYETKFAIYESELEWYGRHFD